MAQLTELTPTAVAFEFSEVLRNWLTLEEMDEVILRNANEYKDSDVCASHDFCDANMAMAEAFDNLGLTTTADIEDCESTEWIAAQDLWNTAWTIAKISSFNSEVL